MGGLKRTVPLRPSMLLFTIQNAKWSRGGCPFETTIALINLWSQSITTVA